MSNTEKYNILTHDRNNRITFDKAKHIYYVDGERYDGITKWVGSFCKPFDGEKIAKKLTSYHPKYKHLEPEDLLDEWESQREYGDFIHDTVEYYVNDGLDSKMIEIVNLRKLLKEHHLIPIVAEFLVFDESIKRASAIDLICWNELTKKYVIVDLKTMSSAIDVESYKDVKMSYPLDTLPDSRYYKYCLQVSLYYRWLVNLWNADVDETIYILHIHKKKAELIPALNLQSEIDKIYGFAKN